MKARAVNEIPPPPQRKREIGSRIFFLLFFAFLWVILFPPIYSYDFWWHLKAGELIWNQKDYFTTDPFSHTRQGAPWTNHEWLLEVVFFLLNRAGGLAFLRGFRTLLLFGAFLLLFRSLVREGGGKAGAAVILVILLVLVSRGRNTVRPDVVTLFFFFAGFLWILAFPERLSLPRFLPFLPLVVLWANLHSAVLVMPYFFTVLFGGEICKAILARTGSFPAFGYADRKFFLRLSLMLFLIWLAVCIQPQGPQIFKFSMETGRISREFTSEWKPLSFYFFEPLARTLVAGVFASLGIFLGTLVHALLKGLRHFLREWDPSRLALSGFSFFLSFYAFRFSWLLFIPLYTLSLYWGRWLQARRASGEGPPFLFSPWFRYGGILLCTAVFVGMDFTWVKRNFDHLNQNVWEEVYPVPLTRMLQETRLEGRMYNPLQWGGYFIFFLYPQYRVFVDGRNDVYGEEILMVNRQVNSQGVYADKQKEQILRPYRLDYLINESPRFFRDIDVLSRWTLVFANANSSCYLKRGMYFEKNLKKVEAYYRRLGVPFDPQRGFEEDKVFQEAPRFWRAINEREAKKLEELEREIATEPGTTASHKARERKVSLLFQNCLYEHALKEAVLCLEACKGCRRCLTEKEKILKAMGLDRLARGDFPGALKAMKEAVEFSPREPKLWELLAEFHWRAGEGKEALEALKRAISLDGRNQALRERYEKYRREWAGKENR